MTNWDLYKTRLGISGVSNRDRLINGLKQDMNNKVVDSPSYREITINGEFKNLVINNVSGKENYKKIIAIDTFFNLGDCVVWKDNSWLIINKDVDNDVYLKGVMQKCNYIIPFQTNSSTIFNEPCIVLTQSEYTSGEDKGSVITISDTQRVIYVQYNEQTKYLIEGKRIFIDQKTDKPKVYHISKVDRICYMDGENGLWKLVCDEDQTSDNSNDNIELKIANYIAPVTPTPQPTPEPTTIYTCKITNTLTPYTEYSDSNVAQIKSGGSKKPFMCHFFDTTGVEVTLIPVWSIDVSGLTATQQSEIKLTFDPAYPLRAYLSALNDSTMIGSKFKLILSDNEGLCAPHAIEVEVKSLT